MAGSCNYRYGLNRVILKLQEDHDKKAEEQTVWDDFIVDLWDKHLPHLREEQQFVKGLFTFDAQNKLYGYQELSYGIPMPNEEDQVHGIKFMDALQQEAANMEAMPLSKVEVEELPNQMQRENFSEEPTMSPTSPSSNDCKLTFSLMPIFINLVA